MNRIPPFGRTAFLIFILVEITSFLGFYFPAITNATFIIAVIAVLIATLTKLEYGIYAVIGDLLLGSKTGALIALSFGNFVLPLRMAIFGIVMSVFAFRVMETRRLPRFFADRLWMPYAAFACILFIATVRGFMLNNGAAAFFDANAFLYFLLILPFYEAISNQRALQRIFLLIGAGVQWMMLKTLLVLYVFSHGIMGLQMDLYDWLDATGVGQVALVSGRFFRVFFQSHVLAAAVFFLMAANLVLLLSDTNSRARLRERMCLSYQQFALLTISIIVILTSFSRSLWLGVAAGVIALAVALLMTKKISLQQGIVAAVALGVLTAASWGAILAVVNIPLPAVEGTAGAALFDRLSGLAEQAAGSTRLHQLDPLITHIQQAPLFGWGFGKELTYATADPKNILETVGGQFTTYAFEWAWLDLWLKTGIVGVLAYWGILSILALRSLRIAFCTEDRTQQAWLFASFAIIIALVVTHVTTPFLNHPLGIGIIMIISASIFTLQHHGSIHTNNPRLVE